jgi:hypothetical protein
MRQPWNIPSCQRSIHSCSNRAIKGKGEVDPFHAMKAYREKRVTAPFILNL